MLCKVAVVSVSQTHTGCNAVHDMPPSVPPSLTPSLALSLSLTLSPSHSLSARLLKVKEAVLQGMDFPHLHPPPLVTHFYQKGQLLLLVCHEYKNKITLN